MKCHDVIKCKLLRAATSVYLCMRFEILTAIIIIFWYVRPCVVEIFQRFRGIYCLRLQDRIVNNARSKLGLLVSCLIVLIPEEGYSAFLGNVGEFMRHIPLMHIRRTAVHSGGCRSTSFLLTIKWTRRSGLEQHIWKMCVLQFGLRLSGVVFCGLTSILFVDLLSFISAAGYCSLSEYSLG